MHRITDHINILLLCFNILGLGAYVHRTIHNGQPYNLILMFFVSTFTLKIPHRLEFALVPLLALVSVFGDWGIGQIVGSVNLSLVINLSYRVINRTTDQIAPKFYEAIVCLFFSISVFLSILTSLYEFTPISHKIIVLACTLPNFYLFLEQESAQETHQLIPNKFLYSLTPFLDPQWPYALGYLLGIYLTTFSILQMEKHIKYFLMALLALIQMLSYNPVVQQLCGFIRAVLVFHLSHDCRRSEYYFILFYTITIAVVPQILGPYLLVGLLALGITTWRRQYRNYSLELDRYQQMQNRERRSSRESRGRMEGELEAGLLKDHFNKDYEPPYSSRKRFDINETKEHF